MNKTIEIDIKNKYDFLEKYNEKKVSRNLIKYIIREAMSIENNDKIKIIINKKCVIEKDCKKMINEGLQEEINKSLEEYRRINKKQIWLFVLGITLLFLSSLIREDLIWNEMLIIIAWVPIWKVMELELFPDMEGRRKRKKIKKLLNSEIIVKN